MNKKKSTSSSRGGKPTKEEYKCSTCGIVYTSQKTNFISSGSPLFAGNGGCTTMCRLCVDALYKKLLGFYNGDVEQSHRALLPNL